MIDDFIGKTIADKYRIDALLRNSDLGDLYRGWHTLMDKPVTVKILAPALAIDKRLVDRFLSEAKTASHASHANILNVTDFGTDASGTNYTVYESAAGETLSTFLGRDGALSLPRALVIAKHVAAALTAAHAKGLVHGSLSPEKILVSRDEDHDTAKVFDFGLEPVGKTSSADIEYLAPEQYSLPKAFDARSDIYTLGVVLYEMLAGVVPYTGRNTAELEAKQTSEPPPPLSAFRADLPADLEPMVLSAMAIDPEHRYQTMGAFAEDLEHMSDTVSAVGMAAAAAAPKRNVWQTAFIALVGISVLAAVLIYATSVKRTDPTTEMQADAGSLPVQPIGPATGAQEESLAKLPIMTEAEILANAAQLPGQLPGGDGFNAWANGGVPPPGAPLSQGQGQALPPGAYIPPGGQVYTIDPNGGSQFMPPDGGVILVPVPANTNTAVKPSPTPKTPGANAVQPTPTPAPTPKPLATPPKTDKPAAGQPGKPAATKPAKIGKPTDL